MSQDENITNTNVSTQFRKISSAVFYGLASFLITVVNKRVLSSPYKFPSFLALGLGQLIASIVVLYGGKKLRVISFPAVSINSIKKIFPLPLIYLGNMIFGLGGTQALSLPMFAALRRFSVLMTMVLEVYVLKTRPTAAVQMSVYLMIAGAILAATDDLSFNLEGYTFLMITNALTAANGVFVKQKLIGSDLGTYGLMFYNSLAMFVPAVLVTWAMGDLKAAYEYEHWLDPMFLSQFILSCVMGFILNYSIVLCTEHNSALTTTIVGSIKNISITYLGTFIGGDYIFSWLNFIGLNVGVVGSLVYTYVTFRKPKKPNQREADMEKLLPEGGSESTRSSFRDKSKNNAQVHSL